MPSEQEVYELIGRLATDFAALEYHLSHLLDRLLEGSLLTMPILIDPLTFYQRIERCKEAAKHYLEDDPKRLAEVTAFLKQVDSFRVKRNLFAHGVWTIQPGGDQVSILTFKLRRHEKGFWQHRNEETMPLRELKGIATQVETLRQEAYEVVESFPAPPT